MSGMAMARSFAWRTLNKDESRHDLAAIVPGGVLVKSIVWGENEPSVALCFVPMKSPAKWLSDQTEGYRGI